MSLFNVLDIAASAMSAGSVRLNLVASNLANADSAASSSERAYHARQPVFAVVLGNEKDRFAGGVRVTGVVQSQAPSRIEFQPEHPMADSEGYVHLSNVNTIEEMANMMSASRSFQTNIEVINTAKQMLLRTLSLGQ